MEWVSNGYCFRCVRRGCVGFQDGMDARAAVEWLTFDSKGRRKWLGEKKMVTYGNEDGLNE